MTSNGVPHKIHGFDDIIALKLKKPKNWNWELTTSKSSPHILLPIIQLYDYKGNLVLETQDTGPVCQRKSWHSDCRRTEKQWKIPRESKLRTSQSERRWIDKRDVPTPNKPEGSISREDRRRSDKNNNDFSKTSCENINVTAGNAPKESRSAGSREQNKDAKRAGGSVGPNSKDNYLKKSRSDLLCKQEQRHQRSRSDDVYKRKLKFNDDGKCYKYSQSLRDANFDHLGDNINERNTFEKDSASIASYEWPSVASSNCAGPNISGNSDSPKIIQPTAHPRYKTRTSSAGTLIISEESFYKPNRRKRPERENTSTDMTSAKISRERPKANSGRSSAKSSENECNFDYQIGKTAIESRRSTLTSCTPIPYRISFPSTEDDDNSVKTVISRIKWRAEPMRYAEENGGDEIVSVLDENGALGGIRRSMSTITPSARGEIEADHQTQRTVSQRQQRRKRMRRKIRNQRHHSDGSTSSNADNAEWKNRLSEGETSVAKACIKPKQHHTSPSSAQIFQAGVDVHDGGSSAADLLDLVRHLSSQADRHVTAMGANVSRHSSKGLSGRRSQSSGSICNGKGRHSKGEFCGSLPSYLDDRDSGGCNNNYDCDKATVDEVPRIPPLGDGAPLHWKFSDTQTALCDQGYGSERSPEEEYPPPLPEHDLHGQRLDHHHFLEPHECYPFVTPESTFLVKLNKGSRGLGLSVTGGIDSGGSWPGLIRIKRLFPHQPASQCGLINVGDLLLEANGSTLIGLTNYEALEVLRTAPNQVELKICRPPPDVLTCVSPISEVPPPPPRREAAGGANTPPLGYSSPEDDYYHGEFEIIINKIQGSLGFTLRKEDDSALGHYVRALVREPALTDGRIRAGDKIVAVNDVEISPMSHEQAVQFLRQCDEEVKLRLYRDAAQTPVAALSPTETTPRTSFSRKSNLRQEAMDMLNDIAVRKLIPGNQDTYRRSLSPSASPRRLRRQPYPSDASQETDHSSIKYPALNDNDQFHEGLLHHAHPFSDDSSLFIVDSSDDCDKPSRPSSLDLYNPNQTPVVARKPRFNFSLAHNAYELNNLDAEVLDAPNLTYNLGHDEGNGPDQGQANDSFGQGPASMPHLPLENSSAGFSYKNPAYQTAHPSCVTDYDEQPPAPAPSRTVLPPQQPADDDLNIRRWKGAILEEKEEPITTMADFKMREENEILAIELNRGWNSRLGFSLQGAAGVTYVSAVYANSVAAKDGRLQPGDRVIRVNDETVEHMTTSEIIDLLRIVRGPVCIVVSRTNSKEDCIKSNAAN